MHRTENLNIASIQALIPPRELKQAIPATDRVNETVFRTRKEIRNILDRKEPRLLLVVGPCSIHDTHAALEYAGRLNALREELGDRLCIVMRTYFEKPRTTVGWKGLINDPYLDGSYDMSAGLHKARELLVQIAAMGLPAGTEMLDPIVPQYIADVVAWCAVGARTIESQPHREMASGLSMPVGMKNATDGNLQIAIDAIVSARRPHHFLGVDIDGRSSVVETTGNAYAHIILRGGRESPNYDRASIARTEERLKQAKLPARLMVDCSHGNSGKRHEWQGPVLRDVVEQRVEGNAAIIGLMLESNLHEGQQSIPRKAEDLHYGVSITDACLGWEETEMLLRQAYTCLAPLFGG